MNDDRKPYELGLYISRHRNVCGEVRVSVTVVRKSDDGQSIRNVSSSSLDWRERAPNKRVLPFEFDHLTMEGHVYVSGVEGQGNELIGYDPRYRDVYAVELVDAQRMLKTLAALDRAIYRWKEDNGYRMTPGAMLAILAKFVGASFMVYRDTLASRVGGFSYDAVGWDFLSVKRGIETYQMVVDQLCAEHVKAA